MGCLCCVLVRGLWLDSIPCSYQMRLVDSRALSNFPHHYDYYHSRTILFFNFFVTCCFLLLRLSYYLLMLLFFSPLSLGWLLQYRIFFSHYSLYSLLEQMIRQKLPLYPQGNDKTAKTIFPETSLVKYINMIGVLALINKITWYLCW